MEMQLIPKEEILEELSKLREEVATTMKWIHIGTVEVGIKATFKKGIDSEIHLSIMDRRINNLRDGCLGTMIATCHWQNEGMLEIAGHEILVVGVAGKENGSMNLGEDHKPWGRKAYIDSGSEICTAKSGVFPKEAMETLPVIAGNKNHDRMSIPDNRV
ncbi:UNVERIFIED_CONTAM: movement protein [Sesamum radiatum]|uniref:Movement protein n=1 Tax=Sesamum radiatum TaxID=300843 RepID=A0AAW2UAK4_SESRA